MSSSRRRFTPEYKIEAAHRVIDSGRRIAEVARELSLNEVTLGNWVREERRRLGALAGTESEPLSAAERAELGQLRKRKFPSRRKTSNSWEKRQRTSPRIHQSGTVRADGRGVRELRDQPPWPDCWGVPGRVHYRWKAAQRRRW